MPSVDLIDMYLRLSDKYGMKFFFGLYDSRQILGYGRPDLGNRIQQICDRGGLEEIRAS